MKLIIGLGNPGSQYSNTRHNIGFLTVDKFKQRYFDDLNWQKVAKFEAQICKTKDLILVKPQTFVNNSGRSVTKITKFYKIDPEDILIIRDDIDLDLGQIRIKTNSGSGGHNGIKSIEESLASSAFFQLKIGVDHPGSKVRVQGHVLGQLTSEEILKLPILEAVDKIWEWRERS